MMRFISRLRVDQNRIGVRGQIRIGGYKSWLHRIKVPTLIVNGTKDFFAGPKYTKELTSGIADARLILFKGGHFGAAENLELFINSALEFLYEVDALAQNA
jgi:pimeloyl-ACP methyl ester carboxylesterase